MTKTFTNSKVIEAIAYNVEHEFLTVDFTSGKQYDYKNVPLAIVEGLINAESVGAYFNKNIRNRGN